MGYFPKLGQWRRDHCALLIVHRAHGVVRKRRASSAAQIIIHRLVIAMANTHVLLVINSLASSRDLL